MARIDEINRRREMRKQAPVPLSPQPQGGSPSQQAGSVLDDPQPITYGNSGIVPTVTSGGAYRQGALRTMAEDEFDRNKETMNASDKEYWSEQAKLDPLNTYANLRNYFASGETPAEKQKRERRERLGQVLSNLGNLIGNAANLYYTAQGASPIDLNTSAKEENERVRRIREKREALKAKQDALLAEARAGDIRNAYNIRLAREKAAAEAEEKEKARRQDMLKFGMKLEADKKKGDADREIDRQRIAEQERHNRAMENRKSSDKSKGMSNQSKSDEVAYITKYGDVIFDNPDNKRAATLSTLEVMRNGAPDEEREKINRIMVGARTGDVDSYNKAEIYVSQHLNNDPVALRHLYELAGKYGRVNADERQIDARGRAINRGNTARTAPYMRTYNNDTSKVAPYARQ